MAQAQLFALTHLKRLLEDPYRDAGVENFSPVDRIIHVECGMPQMGERGEKE